MKRIATNIKNLNIVKYTSSTIPVSDKGQYRSILRFWSLLSLLLLFYAIFSTYELFSESVSGRLLTFVMEKERNDKLK